MVDRSIDYGELLLICVYSFFLTVFDSHFSLKCLGKFVPRKSENKIQTDWSQGCLLQPNYSDLGSDMSSVRNFCTCRQMSFLGNTSSSVVKCGLLSQATGWKPFPRLHLCILDQNTTQCLCRPSTILPTLICYRSRWCGQNYGCTRIWQEKTHEVNTIGCWKGVNFSLSKSRVPWYQETDSDKLLEGR